MTGTGHPAPPIGAHRLLADGRTAALVAPEGTVRWWCVPDVDAEPVLWSLLDPAGAAARWPGARLVEHDPAPAGPATRTVLDQGDVRFECRDGILARAGASVLVRLVRLVSPSAGPDAATTPVVLHELALGGFDTPAATWSILDSGDGAARGGRFAATVTGGSSTPVPGAWLRTHLPVGSRWTALVVEVGVPDSGADGDRRSAGRMPIEDLVAALDEAEVSARRRLGRARLPRHHPERAADALAVLDACTFAPSGAVVAAVTTSLPEAPGGDRQFDYRFSWLRDAAVATSVAALLGHREAARGYLAFVRRVVAEHGIPPPPVVTVRAEAVPPERAVPGVAGWAGSRPVRVGNAAGEQRQFDALGLVVEAVSVYLQTGGTLDADTWALVVASADHAATAEDRPTHGIWELREPRRLLSADIGRWLALDRAIWIARGWRPLARRRRWKRARRTLRRRVLAALTPRGGLPQAYGDRPGDDRPDASALLVAMFGLLGRRSDQARRLVQATLEDLGTGPFLHRYPPFDDGFAGCEGAFLPASWWAVAALAGVGRLEEARARADALCAALPRLLPEEADPGSGEALGNAPLVWSHAEAARALYLLDAAARRRRYGRAGLWVWRLGRYWQLRRGGGDDERGGGGRARGQPSAR